MQRRIGHLPAWVAFDAAARAGTFAAAAEELSVTPAAVSQHVRTLEAYLGVRLFVRNARGVALTEEGRRVYPGIREGLQNIAGAVGLLQHRGPRRCLRVSTSPSFASRWLLPRLHRFNGLYPAISVKLEATVRLVDLVDDNVDVAIRYGRGSYDGVTAEPLLEEYVFPVCSPEILPQLRTPGMAELVRMLPLIHDTTAVTGAELPGWSAWLERHGIRGVDCSKGLFVDTPLAVQAAVEGRGLLLGRSVIVADDLQAGRLVRPLQDFLKVPQGYFFLQSDQLVDVGQVTAFRRWLFDEVARTRSFYRQLGAT